MPSIATQSLKITADTSGLINGINDAASKADKSLDRLKKNADNKTGNLMSKVAIGTAIGTVAGRLLEKVLEKVGETIYNNLTKQGEFNRMLEKANEAAKEQEKILERQLSRRLEMIEAIKDPMEQQKAIAKEIARTEVERNEALAKQERIRDVLTGLENGNADAWQLWAGGRLEQSIDFVKKRLDDATNAVGKFNDRLAELKDKRQLKIRPELDPSLLGEINSLVDQFQGQIETKGMGQAEAMVHMLKRKGATDGMLAKVRALAAELDAKPVTPFQYKDIAAMTKGSQEANSIINKFRVESMFNDKGKGVEDKQLDQLKMIPPKLDMLNKAMLKWNPDLYSAW